MEAILCFLDTVMHIGVVSGLQDRVARSRRWADGRTMLVALWPEGEGASGLGTREGHNHRPPRRSRLDRLVVRKCGIIVMFSITSSVKMLCYVMPL